MGYTTEFTGSFTVTPALATEQIRYLKSFAETRRMIRDAEIVATLPDPIRWAVNLPAGIDGSYFVGGAGLRGQDVDSSVLNHNTPPRTQPGLWCQWMPSEDGKTIAWNKEEKFTHYVEWLRYLVDNFLKPWGRSLDGQVDWQGDNSQDIGVLYARDGRVETVPSSFVNSGPSWNEDLNA